MDDYDLVNWLSQWYQEEWRASYAKSQASQVHVSRKRKRLIRNSIAFCMTRCQVTQGTAENFDRCHSDWQFFIQSSRFKIIPTCKMPLFQNSLRITLKTSVFHQRFQVRFLLPLLLMSRSDTAAEEAWVLGKFSLDRICSVRRISR